MLSAGCDADGADEGVGTGMDGERKRDRVSIIGVVFVGYEVVILGGVGRDWGVKNINIG